MIEYPRPKHKPGDIVVYANEHISKDTIFVTGKIESARLVKVSDTEDDFRWFYKIPELYYDISEEHILYKL